MVRDLVYAVIQKLSADTNITALVGTSIYKYILPNGAKYPAITVSDVTTTRNNGAARVRYANMRVQCTAWAPTDTGAFTLSELIGDCLNIQNNQVYGTAPYDVRVIGCEDMGSVPDNRPDVPIFMRHRDFMIEYSFV